MRPYRYSFVFVSGIKYEGTRTLKHAGDETGKR